MKRLFRLILVMILVFLVACAAAAEGVTFSTAYFTLQLPDGWVIDTEDLESKDGEECLGFFAGPEDIAITGDAYLVYYEDFKDIALWNSDEEELKAYTEAMLEDFKDNRAELIEIVMAGKIPLILIKGSDDEGEFLYAETMTNGYAVEFEFFAMDAEAEKQYPITEEQIEQVKSILATFQPVT